MSGTPAPVSRADNVSACVPCGAPSRVVSISEEKKVDVLLAVMASVRTHIEEWQGRSLTFMTWSTGLLVGAPAIALSGKSYSFSERAIMALGVLVFGAFGVVYLCYVTQAVSGSGRVLVKCESALGLCDPGLYCEQAPFFERSASGEWVRPIQIYALVTFQVVVIVISAMALLLLGS